MHLRELPLCSTNTDGAAPAPAEKGEQNAHSKRNVHHERRQGPGYIIPDGYADQLMSMVDALPVPSEHGEGTA